MCLYRDTDMLVLCQTLHLLCPRWCHYYFSFSSGSACSVVCLCSQGQLLAALGSMGLAWRVSFGAGWLPSVVCLCNSVMKAVLPGWGVSASLDAGPTGTHQDHTHANWYSSAAGGAVWCTRKTGAKQFWLSQSGQTSIILGHGVDHGSVVSKTSGGVLKHSKERFAHPTGPKASKVWTAHSSLEAVHPSCCLQLH
jgi:hypothetical protein